MYKLISNGQKVKGGVGANIIFRLYPLKFILIIKTRSEREKINRRTTAVTSTTGKTYIKREFRT